MESDSRLRIFAALIAAVAILACTAAAGQAGPTPRGEMLYSTYCNGCHTTQIHWRERKLAVDWSSLVQQVRRWQDNLSLAWGADDVAAVARHLNDLYYHFPAMETTRTDDADRAPKPAARAPAAKRGKPAA